MGFWRFHDRKPGALHWAIFTILGGAVVWMSVDGMAKGELSMRGNRVITGQAAEIGGALGLIAGLLGIAVGILKFIHTLKNPPNYYE